MKIGVVKASDINPKNLTAEYNLTKKDILEVIAEPKWVAIDGKKRLGYVLEPWRYTDKDAEVFVVKFVVRDRLGVDHLLDDSLDRAIKIYNQLRRE